MFTVNLPLILPGTWFTEIYLKMLSCNCFLTCLLLCCVRKITGSHWRPRVRRPARAVLSQSSPTLSAGDWPLPALRKETPSGFVQNIQTQSSRVESIGGDFVFEKRNHSLLYTPTALSAGVCSSTSTSCLVTASERQISAAAKVFCYFLWFAVSILVGCLLTAVIPVFPGEYSAFCLLSL